MIHFELLVHIEELKEQKNYYLILLVKILCSSVSVFLILNLLWFLFFFCSILVIVTIYTMLQTSYF